MEINPGSAYKNKSILVNRVLIQEEFIGNLRREKEPEIYENIEHKKRALILD